MPRTRLKPSPTPSAADPVEAGGSPPDLARDAVIRLHAYNLWERRGRRHGGAMEDWLQAEAELARLAGAKRAGLPGPGTGEAR